MNILADRYLDDLTQFVARHFHVPIVTVYLIKDGIQDIVSQFGAPSSDLLCETERFCTHVASGSDRLMIVEDARLDGRFPGADIADGSPPMRFYAGSVITDRTGRMIGVLCVLGAEPRRLSVHDQQSLLLFADVVAGRLEHFRFEALPIESESHYLTAVELNAQIPWTATPAGDLDSISLRWTALSGLSPQQTLGAGWLQGIHPDDQAASLGAWSRSLRSGELYDVEFRVLDATGGIRWTRARAAPRLDEEGRIIRWYGSVEDVHERKIVERRLLFTLDIGRLGAWEIDIATGEFRASRLFARELGRDSINSPSSYEVLLQAVHAEDRAATKSSIDRALSGTDGLETEFRVSWPDGSVHWIRMTGQIFDEGGSYAPQLVGLSQDVTEQREAEERRQQAEARTTYLAYHDPLTGLANRRLLEERLRTSLPLAASDSKIALLSIDLDQFKTVNDVLGHAAGDRLLVNAANRLTSCVRQDDLVVRYGGDEFVVVLSSMKSTAHVDIFARRLVQSLSETFSLNERTAVLGGSIGISIAPDHTVNAEQLMRNADTALYRAKASGRGSYRFFEQQMDTRLQALDALKLNLRDALIRNEFYLLYQPIVDLTTGRTVSFEALMRWNHPSLGVISPTEFIPVAESTGWIVSFGRWALEEACREASLWPSSISVAVNLSAVQLSAGTVAVDVANALSEAGLSSDRLELEVTERVLIEDLDSNTAVLNALRQSGVRIAMDDFGTGYSSLSYLRRFSFDKIKIDRSIVQDLPDGNGGDAIARATIGLGRSLRICTTAEGVETRAQLELIQQEGCTQAQGYLFSRPVTASEVPALAERIWV